MCFFFFYVPSFFVRRDIKLVARDNVQFRIKMLDHREHQSKLRVSVVHYQYLNLGDVLMCF